MKPRAELPNQDPSCGSLIGLDIDDETCEPQKDEGGGHRFDQHLVRSSYHSQGFGIEVTGIQHPVWFVLRVLYQRTGVLTFGPVKKLIA